MEIEPVAYFRSPFNTKFGIPRQSGLAPQLSGRIVLTPTFRHAEAVRGLEGFDYLWLIWEFSANNSNKTLHSSDRTPGSLTVRPPRLGGNQRIGVFASRSPFRPNRLGLSCVALERVEMTADEGPVIYVGGADLMDGTPIYDIKPYVAYADSRSGARSGFVDDHNWQSISVVMTEELKQNFTPRELKALEQVLALDPRPQYHNEPERVYGMPFAGYDVHFQVSEGVCKVVGVKKS